MASQKWIVTWDFSERPSGTFYSVFADEFGPEVQRIQRSVAVCQDDFATARLVALLKHYEGSVEYFALDGGARLAPETSREAAEFVNRVHAQRLHARGRKPSRRK